MSATVDTYDDKTRLGDDRARAIIDVVGHAYLNSPNPCGRKESDKFRQDYGTPEKLQRNYLRSGGKRIYVISTRLQDQIIAVLGSSIKQRGYQKVWQHDHTDSDMIRNLDFIAVDPDHQKQGVAAALYRSFEADSFALKGKKSLSQMATVVKRDKTKMRQWLLNMGYKEVAPDPTDGEVVLVEKKI